MKRWLITIFICLAILGAFGSFKFFEIKGAIDAANARPEYFETVEVVAAQPVQYSPRIKALGTVVAPQQVTLSNELSGYITAVNFKSSASVKKGEVILQLDISEQEAKLASAKARRKLAQAVYNRDVDLRKSSAVSQEAVDRSLSELNVIKAEIEEIESTIRRKTIAAPFDGTIGIHQFEPGQFLNINTVITTLVGQSETMWINFNVPQFYEALSPGTEINIRVTQPNENTQNQVYTAKIIAADSSITSGSRSRLYRAEIANESAALMHNESVEVDVPVGKAQELMAVPAQSIQSNVDGQYVFVLEPEEEEGSYRARSLPVSTKGMEGKQVFIESDMKKGAVVAAAGAFKLREGLLVRSNTRPEAEDTKPTGDKE